MPLPRRSFRRLGLPALAFVVATLVAHPAGGAVTTGPLTVSPQPGTPDASPRTQISLLGAAPADIHSVTVVGSRTGAHPGRLAPYSDASGASYVPTRPFAAGETVHVSVAWGSRRLAYGFTVARAYPVRALGPAPATVLTATQHFLSRPDLHPPAMRVTRDLGTAAPGDLFLAPAMAPGYQPPMFGQYGPMIVDASGNLVWFEPVPAGLTAMDFRLQSLLGTPVLTWWQGRISYLGYGQGDAEIMPASYQNPVTVRAGNGYRADLHEFYIDRGGHAWLTVFSPVRRDLTHFGGRSDGGLLDSIVEEVDIRTGLVMFEWHALGHIGLDESHGSPHGTEPWDAYHLNSIDVNGAGNLLVSARNTWAVYAINHVDGGIIWRVGGKRSTFALGPGARFAWAHDARFEGGGDISLFDDEATPAVGAHSRALLLHLDDQHSVWRATVANQYDHRPSPLLSISQGNAQQLTNGDIFVGWGAQPYLSEFDRAGHLVYDAHFHATVDTYRAYRFPWSAQPSDPPSVFAWRLPDGGVSVFASWNGATDVAAWRVLKGPAPALLIPGPTASRSGFETTIGLGDDPVTSYVAVQALGAYGQVLGTSQTVKVYNWPAKP